MEPTNRRRVVRALEVTLGSGKPFSQFGPGMDSYPSTPFTQIGLQLSRETIDKRISERYEQQVASGFLEEVEIVMAKGLSRTAAPALGYKEFHSHLRGECSLEEAIEGADVFLGLSVDLPKPSFQELYKGNALRIYSSDDSETPSVSKSLK